MVWAALLLFVGELAAQNQAPAFFRADFVGLKSNSVFVVRTTEDAVFECAFD